MSRRKCAWIIIGLLLLIVCCIGVALPFTFCTALGCDSRINITFTGTLPEAYQVEVWYPDDGYVKFQCDKGILVEEVSIGISARNENFGQEFTYICEYPSISIQYAPKEFTVKITWDDGEFRKTVKPDYQATRLNGYFCPPTCYYADITLKIA